MNKIERMVYDAVKGSPRLKFFIRNLYQAVFDLLPTPADFFAAPYSLAENSFFGFHDKTPFSDDNLRLLSCRTDLPLRMPRSDEALTLGYFDLTSEGEIGEYHSFAASYAWNYHKGCRLQWAGKDSVIFNDLSDGHAVSRLVRIDGTSLKEFPFAIDTISADGRVATSFSYERLNVLMPGYGYEYCEDGGCLDQAAPADTGLYLADMEKGERTLLYSLEQLRQSSSGLEGSETENHYVTHTEFSADGRYVSFLHRWTGNDIRKRYSRLCVHDLKSGELMFLPTTGMVSHYIWTPDNRIIAYCGVAEAVAHVIFNVTEGTYRPVLAGVLTDDGHQTMLSEKEFVTDTYPDKRRMASVWRVDIETEQKTLLARVHSPKHFQTRDFRKHIACDLHPRASKDGSLICFDTVLTGKRSICVMKLS